MTPARRPKAETFQELILRLQSFWADYGCLLTQPFDSEKGAGTFNPATFLRAIGPEPWKAAYVEPSRRPTDGRYGDNPNRLYRHHQFQVILKPSPENLQELYLDSLRAIGIYPEEHDIRFVEDNWESPTLGAWGLGWEVWVDGMEATQFTYFEQCGGLECKPVTGELTYGLERLAMYLQGIDNVYDLKYSPGVTYGQVFHQDEVEYSKLSFEELDVPMYLDLYERYEKETKRLAEKDLVVPAYDHLLKAAHAFNALDAKAAISVTERQGYILRIRDLAKLCAEGFLAQRERLKFPLGRADTSSAAQKTKNAPEVSVDSCPEQAEFFFELGTEELPAAEVVPTAKAFAKKLSEGLKELRLSHEEPKVYATPRRMVVAISGLAGKQEDRTVEVAGPPIKAAIRDGEYTKAAIGFAKGQGCTVEQLTQKETKKGIYLYAVKAEKGQATQALLKELVESSLAGLSFKRTMRWGNGGAAFARPVVWMVALYNQEIVPCEFAGIAASGQSRGHRFLAPDSFAVKGLEQYLTELQSRKVLVDTNERRQAIVSGAKELAASTGGALVENDELFDELTQLVEYPVPMLNHFDERFLEIPDEVLISEMQEHQRYLPVVDSSGKLMSKFVVIANTQVEDQELSLTGYRRVLTARFEDGAFFYKEDQKTKLFSKAEKLRKVRFHRALGTIFEKVERVAKLSFWLAGSLGPQLKCEGAPQSDSFAAPTDLYALASGSPAESLGAEEKFIWQLARSAYLCKADLTTHMVYEFPELQGVMGTEYAQRDGEQPVVAASIAEHYLPRGADDELPEGVLGALVGIADRLDTLVGIFATGKGPSGAADPFGLRRSALAIIRILEHKGWHLPLQQAVEQAFELLSDKAKKPADEVLGAVQEFVRTRAKGMMTAAEVPTDVAEAALSAGYQDLVDAHARAQALAALRSSPEFEPLASTFKRVGNILKGQIPGAAELAKLSEPVEKALFEASEKVADQVSTSISKRDFGAALAAIAQLRPTVDAFFDGDEQYESVMVMAKDPEVRAQRVALLGKVQAIFAPLADFTKLS